MEGAPKASVLEDLRREVGRIAAGHGAWQDITKPTDYRAFTPAPADPRLREVGRTKAGTDELPFGQWLLLQADRAGLIGRLAKAALADRSFPRNCTPDGMRERLSKLGADPEMHEALDDAELDWASF